MIGEERLKTTENLRAMVYNNNMAKTKDSFKTFKELFEKQFKTAFDSFDVNLKKAVGNIHLPTPKDFLKLEKRVSELEKKVSRLEKPKKATTRKTTSSSSRTRKPAAAKATARSKRTSTKK